MASRQDGRITITDVAKHAGVSLSTVSRAMNGNPTVDPDLAERVFASARKLGYSASPLARSLVLGKTQTVAMLLPDMANPTFQEILRGFSRNASADGFHVLIADSVEKIEDEPVLARELRKRTDGIVLCAPRMANAEIAALVAQTQPVVLINRNEEFGTDSISAAYESAMRSLIEHLYAFGHRRVAYLSGSSSASNTARLKAIAAARAQHPDLHVVELDGGVNFDSGADAADAVMRADVTGVLAYNDLVAMGLLSALAERGVHAPVDMSVAGFDDIPFARYTTPPLTTASVPAARIGEQAWAALHARIQGDPLNTAELLPVELTVRASTGPARV